MRIESRKNSRNHIMEMLIPFFGVLEPYKISIIPATAILLLAIILLRNDSKIYISKKGRPFLAFVAYIVVRDVLHMFLSVSDPVNTQINRLISNVTLYLLIFVVCDADFDEDALFRWWKIAGVIFGAGMLYHVFQLAVLNQDIQPISLIPGYDIAHEEGDSYGRPTSFFSEPAAYVVSMLPLLFLSLKRKNFMWAAISAFLIVLSTSTVGVVLSAVLWIVFVLMEKKSFKTTLLYIVYAVVFVILFLNLQIFSDALEKLQAVSDGESTWGSRIEGPFQMVTAMKWYELPFGTNVVDTKEFVYHNMRHFAADSNPYISAKMGETVFLNTYAKLIFRYGIAGLVLFLRIFKGKLFGKKYEARMYAIMLIVACIAQGAIADPGVPLIMILLYTNKKEEEHLIENR